MYASLYRVASVTGFKDIGAEIVGQIWVAALLSLEEGQRQELLRSLPTGHQFFVLLRSLPFVLERVRFEPSSLIQRFVELRKQIGNDLAQRGYWRGIEAWALTFPDDAFKGLEILLQADLDDNGIAMAASILGSLRVAWERAGDTTSNFRSAEELAQHQDVAKRLVYHRSWITTGWTRGLSDLEFRTCIARMTGGVAEERGEAFNFLRCLITDHRTEQDSVDFAVAWLTRETNPSLPDTSKHWVASIVHNLGERWVQDDTRLESLLPPLLAVQPVPLGNKGTWTEIEHLLVELLHKNLPQFSGWLLALLDANPAAMIKNFREHRGFEYLCSEMGAHGATHVVAPLFFSTLPDERESAFAVYDKLPFDSFPDGMLSMLSDDEIALLLFESQRHYLQPEHTFLLLNAVRERAAAGKDELCKLFCNELLYQAKNLPGAVLDRLKLLTNKSVLVQEIVKKAEAYFEKLHTAHSSAINSMEIPGWRRALFIRSRQQSRDIETHQTEFSVFSQLFSKSYLIYGSEGFRVRQ